MYKMRNQKFNKIKSYQYVLMFIFLGIFGLAQKSYAAPAVSNVSGTISDGESITVSGSGFGIVGPDIEIFDDFEKGTNGNAISTVSGSAQVNQWAEAETEDAPKYSNAYAHSGLLSNVQAWDESLNEETTFQVRANFQGSVTEGEEAYFSYWIFIPAGGHVPSGPSNPNWKLWTIYGRPFASNYSSPYTQTVLYEELPTNYFLCPDAWYDDSGRDGMTADSIYGIYDEGYCPFGMNKGEWHRMEAYLKAGSSSNGALGTWEMNSSLARRQIGYQTGLTTIHPGDYWDTIGFPAYSRGADYSNPVTKTYYDDIYVATGAGARARVEIGNAPTYSECTNLATITPTSWSDTSISATVRQGSFSNGSAYLFVVDADGAVSEGKQITIGSSSDDNVLLDVDWETSTGSTANALSDGGIFTSVSDSATFWSVEADNGPSGQNTLLMKTPTSGSGELRDAPSLGNPNVLYVRYWLKMHNFPSPQAASMHLIYINDTRDKDQGVCLFRPATDGSNHMDIISDGHVYQGIGEDGNENTTADNVVLVPETWYRWEFKITSTGTGTGTVEVRLDGTDITDKFWRYSPSSIRLDTDNANDAVVLPDLNYFNIESYNSGWTANDLASLASLKITDGPDWIGGDAGSDTTAPSTPSGLSVS